MKTSLKLLSASALVLTIQSLIHLYHSVQESSHLIKTASSGHTLIWSINEPYIIMKDVCVIKSMTSTNGATQLVAFNANETSKVNLTLNGPLHKKLVWELQLMEGPIPSKMGRREVCFFVKEAFPGNWFHFNEDTMISEYLFKLLSSSINSIVIKLNLNIKTQKDKHYP